MNAKGLSALGLIALAIVVAFGSAAFACTEFRGKMTFTATGAGASGSATRTGNGQDGHGVSSVPFGTYGYCEGFPDGNVPTQVGGTTKTFRLDVAPGPASGCGSGLQAPDYTHWEVVVAPDTIAADDSFNCFPQGNGSKTLLGTLSTSGGSGTGNYTLPDVGAWNICVAEDDSQPIPFPNSNQAPPSLSVLYI